MGSRATPRVHCTFPLTRSRPGLTNLTPTMTFMSSAVRVDGPSGPFKWLVGQGYTATNIAGGMDMWFESGLPMVSENGLKPVVL